MTRATDIQRDEDAALFEDWSAWSPDIVLHEGSRQFELRPRTSPAVDIVRALPDAKAYRWHRYDDVRCWLVPMRHWRAVKAAMPRIHTINKRFRRREKDARLRRHAESMERDSTYRKLVELSGYKP